MRSYGYKTIEENRSADNSLLGVRLGALCILHDVSVQEVADKLTVSRVIVYRWFKGKSKVSRHLQDKVAAYIRILADKPHHANDDGLPTDSIT